MSKVDELIQELCPNGVERVALSELLSYEQPGKYAVKSTEYRDEYQTPVLTAGQSFILGYTDEEGGIYPASPENPVVIFDDFTTSFKWVDFPFKVKSSAMKLLTARSGKRHDLRFVYYAMQTIDYQPVEHARQWIGIYSKFQIPLPPLEVQEEIARILDQFVELDRELEDEIAGREKQFQGVRDDLMREATNRTVQLGDLGSFIRGNGLQKKDLKSSGFPAIHYGQIHTHYSHKADSTISFVDTEKASSYKQAQPGDVILATTSEDDEAVGKATAWIGSNPVAVSGDAFIYQHEFHPLFISFWLGGSDFQYQKQKFISGAKVRRLSGQSLAKIVAPFPPPEDQEEIAAKLDTFTEYIDNLKRERELRQKQYEYYRDQLLDFKVKE